MTTTVRCLSFAALAAFPLAGFSADALPPVSVEPDAVKTHALFMGTEVSIEKDHKLYKVQRVAGTSFVISVDGKADVVPMRGGYHNLKLAQGLKLTAMQANFDGLTMVRAYTARSDPRMKRLRASGETQAALTDESSLAMGQYTKAQSFNFLGDPPLNPHAAGYAQNLAQREKIVAEIDTVSKAAMQMDELTTLGLGSHNGNGAGAALDAQADLAKELFDAIEINFTASAPQPLNDPFVVVVVQFHDPKSAERKAGNMIYARAVDRVDDKPQKIHILQGGLPPGYTLDSCQVHLYNFGEEVATNASPKHVSLTRDEAFGYLLAQYIGTHRGDTAPAEPVIGRLTPQERARLTGTQVSDYYYVKVSRDGVPEAVFADEACTKPVEPNVEMLAKNVRFYPALDKGQRVEGTARLVFTHLTL